MISVSSATLNGMLKNLGLSEQIAGGLLYLYAGPVPTNADAALDMTGLHTQVAVVSKDGLGVDGLTFEDPVNGVLAKAAAEAWESAAAFDGADDGLATLTVTFYRFCASGDDGRAAAGATDYRVQGTVGLLHSTADLKLAAVEYAETDPIAIGEFYLKLRGG